MKGQQMFFWISLLFYLISIYSIVVAIYLFLQGEKIYFITFLSFYLIDKILTIAFMTIRIKEWNDDYRYYRRSSMQSFKQSILFWILDFFSLGFIQFLITESFFFELQESIETKIYTRVVPQIFLEFLFFFCLDQPQNIKVLSYVRIASLINFLLFTFLYLILILFIKLIRYWIIYLEDYIQAFSKQFLDIFTYFTTLCSLTFYKDSIGFNLIFYQLVLVILNEIVLLVLGYQNKEELNFEELQFEYIRSVIGFTDFYGYEQDVYQVRLVLLFDYLKQIISLILLCVFGFNSITYMLYEAQNQIQLIFTISSIVLSLIYLLFYFKDVLNFFIMYKSYKIRSLKDLIQVSLELNQKYRNIKKIEVSIFEFENKDLLEKPILHSQEMIVLQFWQAISFQLKLDTQIEIFNKYDISSNRLNIIINVEVPHKELIGFSSQLIHENIDYIILKRLENGFLNQYTIQILNQAFGRDKSKIFKVLAERYFITAYYKHIAQSMQYNPNYLLFDLFDT